VLALRRQQLMSTSTRPQPCCCPTCTPPVAPDLGRLTTWFVIVATVLIPGRALFHVIWGAFH
jgi:hypothetical protein